MVTTVRSIPRRLHNASIVCAARAVAPGGGEQRAPGPGNARFGGEKISLGDVSVFHLKYIAIVMSCLPRGAKIAQCSLSKAGWSSEATLTPEAGQVVVVPSRPSRLRIVPRVPR